MNAEFQRIARRDKKAFFNDQCKEIEENYRMGKTRDLFKKIRDMKGTFQAKMGPIKDRNGMDQQKQKILRRGGKNTQKTVKKDLYDPDNHDGVITHLEPDILECEVKWALENIRRRQWQPTPVLLPGKSQGQQSLVGCRLWDRTESDMTEAT